jgi:hypothetical protein
VWCAVFVASLLCLSLEQAANVGVMPPAASNTGSGVGVAGAGRAAPPAETPTASSPLMRAALSNAVTTVFNQLVSGCGNVGCHNQHCATASGAPFVAQPSKASSLRVYHRHVVVDVTWQVFRWLRQLRRRWHCAWWLPGLRTRPARRLTRCPRRCSWAKTLNRRSHLGRLPVSTKAREGRRQSLVGRAVVCASRGDENQAAWS